MYEDYEREFEKMIGSKISQIFMNEDYLKFVTDKGNFVFEVEGDCCSKSVFYDFYGVKKLFGKEIKSIDEIDLEPSDTVITGS